eukprot:CAMPEP_0172165550 /NCGR_PEP_ID=MMETSP1050-20130122/8476_1 /TAXON_ID=233186 /ORGANISM="Cryptomonas curvata, Strain CCAP979/52" /LENGTH=145 /DNA_ID=CAMNT_0012836037 /DNA_START=180 /DNA_END=613 /DNA_ORIENTATION=+
MDLRIDQVLKALDGELSTPAIQERSWIPWLPPREGVLRFRSTQYINFHGPDHIDTKVNRKVEVLFKASELGLSPAAQDKLVQIVGKRHQPTTGLVRLTSRELRTAQQNRARLERMVAQLVYFSRQAAGEDPLGPPHHAPARTPPG